jgi:hypothetical protein
MAAGERTGAHARVDVIAEVEALAEVGPRPPGSDGERRAGLHVARRLEALGRTARVEALFTWPRWFASFTLLAVLGAGAGVASVYSQEAGVGLALVALVLYLLEAGAGLPLARRLFGRRASQNVVSPTTSGDRPGALFLVAHADTGRTGLVHRPGVRRLFARVARPRRLVGGPLQPLAWLLAAALAGCFVRLAGVDAAALTAVQFALTVALLATIPLLADIWLSPAVVGAGDNASGVALALRLADRLDTTLEHFGVHVVVTGAQEAGGADGMRAFLRRRRRELSAESTVMINLDEVGAGTPRFTVREGPLLAARSHVQLTELAEAAGARPFDNRTASDGFAARYAGYPAITITCRDDHDLAPRHHRRSDLPEHVERASLEAAEELCVELVERLDASLGPDLR